jgi:putative DNA primase/helicase
LKAEDALYSDGHYVSIGGLLYRFTGSYYEELNESSEKRRIGGWLKTYSEKVKGVWVKNRADTASVNAVFSWVVNQTAVDPVEVNPGGLNCPNGVVKINPDGSHLLVPHDPKNIYTYVGCKYDPNIDLTDCDRLLECLEPSQREIFLRTAAAALNLKLVRSKLTGRGVKVCSATGKGQTARIRCELCWPLYSGGE